MSTRYGLYIAVTGLCVVLMSWPPNKPTPRVVVEYTERTPAGCIPMAQPGNSSELLI